MKITFRLDKQITDGQRSVFWNDTPSYHVDENELQVLLKQARMGKWKNDQQEGIAIGSRLFQLLDRSGGQFTRALGVANAKGEELYLYLDLPFEIDALPFELLYDRHFLLLERNLHIIQRVNDCNRLKKKEPVKRELKLLFMAASPLDAQATVLQFENEEELILKATERFPVDIRVEDSGSLQGLADALYEGAGYDIIHLSGHANIEHDEGPVFYLEDEIGQLDKTTPDQLWEAIQDFAPHILFLSGCMTGKSDKLNVTESFARQMVEKGIPLVLGWALPVSDEGATLLAARVYELLAKGKSLDYAVQKARESMNKRYHPWPLLRIFSDGSKLKPIIAAGQKLSQGSYRQAIYKHLQNSNVQVLDKGFVGRRREIQKGLRVLKGFTDKDGLLIHGIAGVGKSCLAGKMIERLQERKLLVFHGILKRAEILGQTKKLFDREGMPGAIEIMNSELEYDEKIKSLFRNPFKELSTLIYFDDFEQNLYRDGDHYYVKKEIIDTIMPFLRCLSWSEGQTHLIITSRYPFILEIDGANLPVEQLEDIPLMSFRGPDLEKKKNELPNIAKSTNSKLYMEFGKGNPRLMEWLEKIAEQEEKYNLKTLQEALKGKSEEFIQQYLAEILAKSEGEAFSRFLKRSAVYRLPVDQSAYEGLGEKVLLEIGVNLTLFEKEVLPDKDPTYWVTPVLRQGQWDKLSDEEKRAIHRRAYQWYDARIEEDPNNLFLIPYLEEAVHHALECHEIRGACKHAILLGEYFSDLLLYQEQLELQQQVADQIDKAVIEEAISDKDDSVSILFNNLGFVYSDLSDAQKAMDFYNEALQITLDTYGDHHPSVARGYNNVGEAWRDLGDARKAIDFFNKSLLVHDKNFQLIENQ